MDSEVIVALVALIFAVIAFAATILQIFQQYTATADGYRRCAESVIGPWSRGTRRRFRPSELRFEVLFEAPVIFLAPPTNPYGPIPNRKINYMDGSPESYQETMTLQPRQQKQADDRAREKVHTADDERASWVTLLQILQRQEGESRAWDAAQRTTARGVRYKDPEYTLAVGIQAKRRSWDFMPDSVTKPYATTTMSHLVEIVSTLGMYWKAFEDMRWHFRAEGNGLLLLSYVVSGLGLMTTISTTGRSAFREQRAVPNHKIKNLCFGSVPLFLEIQGISDMMHLGPGVQAHRTLEMLGVSRSNLQVYREGHSHLFPSRTLLQTRLPLLTHFPSCFRSHWVLCDSAATPR